MEKPNLRTSLIPFFYIICVLTSCLSPQRERAKVSFETFPFLEYDIALIRQGYEDGSFRIRDVVQAYLDRIDSIDQSGPTLNSIITVNPDATQIAESLEEELRQGKSRGPLHGIPILLKDNIDTHDSMPNTAGSRAMANSYPHQDSYIAKRLREAGAVVLGKANLSEWANFRGQLSSSGWSGLGGQCDAD